MKKTYLSALLSALLVLLSSCAGEYDISNLDKTITVGGEELAFPLGSSTMEVDLFLDLFGIEELRMDDEGNYYFNYSGMAHTGISFPEFKSSLSIPSQMHSVKELAVMPPVHPDDVIDAMDYPVKFIISDEDVFSYEYDLSQALSEGLIRLDSLGFEDSYIRVGGRVSCPGMTDFQNFGLTARVVIPSRFGIVDSRMDGDTLVCSTELTDSAVEYEPVAFNTADMSDCRDLRYRDSFTFKSLILEIPDAASYRAVMGKRVSVALDIVMEGEKSDDIVPVVLTGLVDKTARPVTDKLSISGIPGYMKNATLDLLYPILNEKFVTNATFPLNICTEMSSFVGGELLAKTSASLLTGCSPDPGTPVTGKYVLANEELEASGYKYVFADVKSLVNKIPDSVLLNITPSFYIGDSATDVQTVYLDAGTSVDVRYDFMLPLALGPDVLMTYRDTISNIPDFLADLMSGSDVSIFGTVVSTLPVEMSLKVNLLDENRHFLGISSSTATIASAPERGVPSTTEYSVDVMASEAAKSFKKMEVVLNFQYGTSVNLNKDDYVQISLKASVPGGVTITEK